MSRIFVSYRRSDSPDIVGRIYDHLIEVLPDGGVFRDIDSIPLGVSFPLFLHQALESTHAVLVVIGPGWLRASDSAGRRRLDDPGDFVRIEVETALRSPARVIPVLVGGALMPTADQLPETCRDLANRNGLQVRQDPDFHRDMTRLITELEAVIGLSPSLPSLTTAKRLELGVLRFFRAQGKYAPAFSLVFGEAKSIVRSFKTEQDVFEKVQAKIEERKRIDPNWTYANQINAGLLLVHALGLAPETAEENRIFLLMPLPEGVDGESA